MEKNMTAIEWMFQSLWEEPKDRMAWQSILDKAKEMEKEQIVEAFNSGQAKEASECFWTKGNFYYENKYGTKSNGS
jgi:hypothetical protein